MDFAEDEFVVPVWYVDEYKQAHERCAVCKVQVPQLFLTREVRFDERAAVET